MKKFSFDKNYFLTSSYKNIVSSGWKKYFGQYFWARRYYAQLIKKHKKSGRVLEIGCGLGDLLHFLEENFETYGIDISDYAIKKAKKKAKNSILKVMKAKDIDAFRKNFFDVIVSCHLLEHLPNPSLVLAKIGQILKKDGIVLIAVPNTSSLGRKMKKQNWVGLRDKTHISLLPPDQWLNLLRKNGLEPFKKFSDGFWDAPYLPLIPSLLQKILFGLPCGIQAVLGFSFLPVPLGESLIILAKKVPIYNNLNSK